MARKKPTEAAKSAAGFERAIWRGSISFGLVQIPVGLYRADAEQDLHFTMLDKRDHAPVRFERKNSVTGKPIEWKDIVKGFEVKRGAYVVLTDEDFAEANVQATGGIDITDFVEEADVDAAYFVKPYYLLPQGRAEKTYALLREALSSSGKVGVAKIVLRTRQHLALVRARGEALVLQLVRFAHELRASDELAFPRKGKAAGLSERELKMARSLIDSMSGAWKPEQYRDDYHDDLLALIERKRRSKGTQQAATKDRPKPAPSQVVDIVALLQKSVGARRGSASDGAPARKAGANATAGAKTSPRRRAKPAAKRPTARHKPTRVG